MQDRLEDIEKEFNRTYSSEAEKQMVGYMKEGIKFGASSIEFANQKWGPWLKLRKWSNIIARDMDAPDSQYTEPLCGVYRQYIAARGKVNPLLQLGTLLAFSMVGHHMKMDNNPDWEPLAGTTDAPIGAPPATPYNYPPSQYVPQPAYAQPPATTAAAPSAAARPTFPKPPSMQFGG